MRIPGQGEATDDFPLSGRFDRRGFAVSDGLESCPHSLGFQIAHLYFESSTFVWLGLPSMGTSSQSAGDTISSWKFAGKLMSYRKSKSFAELARIREREKGGSDIIKY